MNIVLEGLLKHATEHPDWTAAVDQEGSVTTFAGMDEASSRVAWYLREQGIGREKVVVIKMPRCAAYIAVMLGVMKVGAAYLCVEGDLKQERLEANMRDTKASMLFTTREWIASQEADPLPVSEWATPDEHDLAFVCSTSGSTGNPKAAAQEYGVYDTIIESEDKALLHYMQGEDGSYTPLNKCIPGHMIFISSIMVITSAICHGCPIYFPQDGMAHDTARLAEYIRDNDIHFIYLTSSGVKKLQEHKGLPLKIAHTGGEVASGLHSEEFDIMNCYSMSEIGYILLSFYIREPFETTPVGYPLEGAELRLVDIDRHPVDDFGILCVRVPYFRGYLGMPERTRNSFIELDGKRFFVTGDVTEIDDQGRYVIRGRYGDTIEILGVVVEPSQVEAEAMHVAPELGQVAARGFTADDGTNYLALYYVADEMIPKREFRRKFAHATPHLKPSVFIRVDEFPLTSGGKIFRRGLPVPVAEDFLAGGI